MTAALEGGEWSAARPGRTLPPGKTRYPFYRRLGGLQRRSGRAEYLVPTGIQSRTVQTLKPIKNHNIKTSYAAYNEAMQQNFHNFTANSLNLMDRFHFITLQWRPTWTLRVSVMSVASVKAARLHVFVYLGVKHMTWTEMWVDVCVLRINIRDGI